MTDQKPPSLSEAFNHDLDAAKLSNSVLRVGNSVATTCYDFTQRIVMNTRGAFTPFSQMDREVLVLMRDKLIELGGQPPELPPEAPATQAPARKFNL